MAEGKKQNMPPKTVRRQPKQNMQNTRSKPAPAPTQSNAPKKNIAGRIPFGRGGARSRKRADSVQTPAKDEKKLRVIPLGGLNEIGKNMTVLEYGDDIIIVDCGMTFPDDELLGVDMVIPDTSYLLKNAEKVRGIVLTHAHEDHIGALPYVLRDLNVPIYCTALTAGIIKLRISEHRNLKKVKINVRKAGDHVKLGCFDVEFIHVNHSIPDACAFAINSPVGYVVMTGDFKIDSTPVDGSMINLERFGQLGRQGVRLLMCDSTNAERPGITMSERRVGDSFDREFKGCDKRIIIATFASNVHRLQQIIDVAAKYGRKVAVSGRSMENILKVGLELGYIKPPAGVMVELSAIKKYPKNKLVIITTGSQGEPMSALYRMAFSGHRQVEVGEGDKILIAATPIPGNEKSVYGMINELFRKGAEVVYERLADIHVSGHACQEEIKMIISLVKPEYYMPVHGEYRHLMINAQLGRTCGVPEANIFIGDLGKVIEIGSRGAAVGGTVPSGRVLVDGYGVGDVGAAVLRERKNLGQDGIITAVIAVDMKRKRIVSGPEIHSRGFIFVREAEEIMTEMAKQARSAMDLCWEKNTTSRSAIKETISSRLSDYLYKKTKRTPVILPVIVEV